MDHSVDGDEEAEDRRSSSSGSQSPIMDRNPSPPPDTADGQEDDEVDAIGETVYSKHWLFSTLTRLVQIVTEQEGETSDAQIQLADDDEEDLCRVWDMAMDKDVAGFLQEFKAADILLGVIAKSRCPRLTEICVGILGNIACFPDTCLTLSQNEDLSAVLLLLLGDSDPPTILETSRLLLTCLLQKDVCDLWLQRIRQQPSVCLNLCFIMSSSTNMDLLVKVGELVDKLFDLDEELMRSWITSQPGGGDDGDSSMDVVSALIEASKQLRSESPDGLEIYLHALQLLTTIDEGIEILAALDGPSKAVWDFLSEVVCEDLCQPDDPPLILQEQKVLLVEALAVLSALYRCQDQYHGRTDTYVPLVGSMLRVLQFNSEQHQSTTDDASGIADAQDQETKDEQLQALMETTAEFLADMFTHIPKDAVEQLVVKGDLTEKTCLLAAGSLLPHFTPALQHLVSRLSETDPQLADMLRKQLPVTGISS